MRLEARKWLTLGSALLLAGAVAACGDDDDGGGGGGCDDNPTGPGCVPAGDGVLEGTIAANRTLFADTTYTISGFVKVPAGVTLTIPAGTTLIGDTTRASALFILRGGRIEALGEPDDPIVMTSARAEGNRRPGDWGGLIIVGNARINRSGAVILEGTSTRPEDNVNYGEGANDADNSGTLRYTRIEYAGFAEAQNQELNGLTLAAVGSGTTIEGVQVVAGLDDSFEWFGGTVNARYLVSYESGDDHFDAAEGFRGKSQYLIALQTQRLEPVQGSLGVTSNDPQGFEIDGCDTGATGCVGGQASEPFNMPVFANFTVIGPGPGVVDATNGGYGLFIRRGTGGLWMNGVVGRWPKAGLTVRDTSTVNRLAVDSLVFRNILFVQNGAALDPSASNLAPGTTPQLAAAAFDSTSAAALTEVVQSLPTAALGTTETAIDWNLAAAAPAFARTGALARPYTGVVAARATAPIEPTEYVGAAGVSTPEWWAGWTTTIVK